MPSPRKFGVIPDLPAAPFLFTTTGMRRCVEPEWLDELPPTDRRAVRSRRDLRRLNALMGHARLVADILWRAGFPQWGRRIVDLGAGDGRFLLKVARHLGEVAGPVEALMIDRADLVDAVARQEFQAAGWNVTSRIGDVFEALADLPAKPGTALLANLFLHHFEDEALRRLLRRSAEVADLVLACEPRRSAFGLAACRLTALAGCNAVTRHDAVVSVKAGFAGSELSLLWPDPTGWRIRERGFGWFSHQFVCRKK